MSLGVVLALTLSIAPVAVITRSAPVAVITPSAPVRQPAPAGARHGWPVDDPRAVRRFDPPAQPWLSGHRGVDLAAPPSAVVRASGRGIVVYAGRIAGRGVVSVRHADGLRTTYEPVEPEPLLRAGFPVTAGEPIGRLATGHPGCPAAACLHWGLRRGQAYLDPLALLGMGRVRLLPLQPVTRQGLTAGR